MNTQAHAEEAHAGASVGTNMAIWIGLVAITVLEVFLAYEELAALGHAERFWSSCPGQGRA